MGGCLLFWFCYLPFVVVTLASFLAAQMFCGFQAKSLENVPSQRALLKVWCLGAKAELSWAIGDLLK